MKRVAAIFISIILITLPLSCEKETMLTVNQSSLSFNNSGGSQTVNLLANKVWSASSNQGWCKVSPSSGDGSDNSNFTLSVSCEANTMYDERSCMITVVCEELTTTITVTQAEGKGLIVSQTEYNLSNEAQTISVEVQANVQYSVSIDDACKSWIKQESTKGLSLNTIKFAISKNESYDGREGKITVKQTDGSLSGTVVVKQSQTNAMIVDQTTYDISYEEQQLSIKVMSNINYEVQIDDSCKDWISQVGTKGLTESTVSLAIEKNEGEDRTGSLLIKFGSIEEKITIIQRTEGYVEFEDPIFKAYCVTNFDKNGDGEISLSEAKRIKTISIDNENVSSLKGIEDMPNLKTLSCRMAGIDKGKLTRLDVSQNTALRYLDCCNNQLRSLDVSDNSELRELDCSANHLTSLDVSQNTALTKLDCNNNQLTSFDVSKNNHLQYLYCFANQLTSLDVSNNSELEVLWCSTNQLTSLDVSKNSHLQHLNCSTNQLTRLDVSQNTALRYLDCCSNQLTSLNLSNVTVLELHCNCNQLTSLDVSNNTELVKLDCGNNQLKSLDVSGDTALEILDCGLNQLTGLDISSVTALKKLYCFSNLLISLDVSKNTALVYIDVLGNQLTSLDVSGDTALEFLDCYSNQLTSLDVSNNTALKSLQCSYNQLTSLDVSSNTDLESLQCYNNQLISLDVSNNTALLSFGCYDNQLTSLDVSNNTALLSFGCGNNQLTKLDVSNNTALQVLSCGQNQLTSLDVSKNTALERLNCYYNQLTSLDVSNNSMLSRLRCYSNPYLKEIWLKTNQTIPDFQYDKNVATIKYK